jgi:hypothetical protein
VKKIKKKPEFILEKVKYEPSRLTQMVVSNKIVCMVQRDNHIIRLDLENPTEIQGKFLFFQIICLLK